MEEDDSGFILNKKNSSGFHLNLKKPKKESNNTTINLVLEPTLFGQKKGFYLISHEKESLVGGIFKIEGGFFYSGSL